MEETTKKAVVSEDDQNITIDQKELKIKPTKSKRNLYFLILGIIFLLGGIGCLIFALVMPSQATEGYEFPTIPSISATNDEVYSDLTGEALADASLKNSPAFCIQTPNDTYGARPQTGLNDAGVIFEAIAEAGITRFAAIYQNPQKGIVGAVRSLRLYYLDWDMPFDCTIIHAGGSDEALAAVRSRGTKDMTENYDYMYRGNYAYHSYDNLFLTPGSLRNFSKNSGYTESHIKGFARLTPKEAADALVNVQATNALDITAATTDNTSAISVPVPQVNVNFGNNNNYNIIYTYNASTNSYDRSYVIGGAHKVYDCPNDRDFFNQDPADHCPLVQLSPSVVIAMIVSEKRNVDGYHEDITTVSSGKVYVFQNGTATKGTWTKASVTDQIKFFDEEGKEIKLIPGQTWISAIPSAYGGSVDY